MSDCPSPLLPLSGEFPKCTRTTEHGVKVFSAGALLGVTFLGQARKVTRDLWDFEPVAKTPWQEYSLQVLLTVSVSWSRLLVSQATRSCCTAATGTGR